MTTLAQAVARAGQEWTMRVRIEGLGTYADGVYVWTLTIPTLGASSAAYTRRDTLRALPKPREDRAPPLGGMPKLGGVSVELVDVGNLITEAAAVQVLPSTTISTAITATSTTINVADGSTLPSSNFLVYVGAEAIRVSSRSANVLTVEERGALETDARSHPANAAVWARNPRFVGRRLFLDLMPRDAATDAEVIDLGSFLVEDYELSDDLGAWIISGPGELRYTSRELGASIMGGFKVTSVSGTQITWAPVEALQGEVAFPAAGEDAWPWGAETTFTTVNDNGLVRLSWERSRSAVPTVIEYAAAFRKASEIKIGDILRPVLAADPTYGSFRWSPGPSPSTSRSTGFVVTAHPIDILLCLILSSAHPDDGLELVNFNASEGNWSGLPPGYGIGMPVARVDVGSFIAVRARTAGYQLPALVVGAEGKSFAEWAAEQILEPIGAYLAFVGGRLTCVLPRTPTEGDTIAAALTPDNMLEVSRVRLASELMSGAIRYVFRTPGGGETSLTVRSSELAALNGGRSQYTTDERATVLRIDGAATDQGGLVNFLRSIAQRRLYRTARPLWSLEVRVGAELYGLRRGDIVTVTHPDLPNNFGTRGWSAVVCLITDASPVTLDERIGAQRTLRLLAFVTVRSGRVAPAARVTAVTLVSGTTYDVTVEANRYTAPDADDAGLPAADAAAFTALDALRLCGANGVPTAATVAVISVTGNVVRLTSSSAPTVGQILRFANYPDATTTQRGRFVATANDAAQIATGVDAWEYAET